MEWKYWSNVLFSERYRLPSCSGIYLVADANNCVWYVGQAVNLQNRWAGRSHHRYPQLIRSNRQRCYRIYWQAVQVNLLDQQEKYYIDLFKPELNGCKVKKYIPKQPQIDREIKRLLKVLNNPTFLFPIIRSLIIGEYEDSDGTRCLVIAITINDFDIISNSARKRYSAQVRNAWTFAQTYCGKDEQQYSYVWIPTYSLNGYKLEFVELPELLNYLEDNPIAYEHYVGVADLFGVQVKVLKNLSFLEQFKMEEEYNFRAFDGKKGLTKAAYINYRKPVLKCLLQ